MNRMAPPNPETALTERPGTIVEKSCQYATAHAAVPWLHMECRTVPREHFQELFSAPQKVRRPQRYQRVPDSTVAVHGSAVSLST